MCKLLRAPAVLIRRTHDLILPPDTRKSVGRHRTRDVAFQFRMGAGFPGDVNRGHPASIEPCLIDAAAPPTAYGQAVVVDPTTQGVRILNTGDTGLTAIWGVTVRPYPIQQSTSTQPYAAAPLGSVAPPTVQPIDVLKLGYILIAVVGAPVKGNPVFIWVAAPSGAHVTGGFEASSSGSTISLDPARYAFNSPADSTGVCELIVRD